MGKSDMPIGFIMSIFKNKDALKYFSNLDEDTKIKISDYIKNSTTSDQAKERIYNSIEGLSSQNLHFLN